LYALKASEIKGYIHANLRYFIDWIKFKSKEERKEKKRTLTIGQHINNLTD
jgi:hypothetical protein